MKRVTGNGTTNFKVVNGNGKINFKVTPTTSIVSSGLILNLDASNASSYPGTGTVWSDLSGAGNNFNIVATAYNPTGVKYMDFKGSYGCAKNASNISLNAATGVTYVMWTRILNSTSTWRTLTRAYSDSNDHQVIIVAGGNNLGMYDGATSFIGTGYSVTSIPNFTTGWYCLYWRWQNLSPYYEFSYNDTPGTIRGSITSPNGAYQSGFGALGAYHNENTTPSSASQFWGDIAHFMCYNRRLTDAELTQNYNVTKARFGL
jgi:hypothetical protein